MYGSSSIDTNNLYANIWVNQLEENKTELGVYLKKNGVDLDCLTPGSILNGNCEYDTTIMLDTGDYFTATVSGETYAFNEDSNDYGVIIPHGSDNKVYTVSLHRDSHADALNSQVTVPGSMEFQLPEQGYYKAEDIIPVSWTPSGLQADYFHVTADVSCALLIDGNTGVSRYPVEINLSSVDSGHIDVSANSLLSTWNLNAYREMDTSRYCRVTLILSRYNTGSIDTAFGGGTITGKQKRERVICIDPK